MDSVIQLIERLKENHIIQVNSLEYQEKTKKYSDNYEYIVNQKIENEDFNIGFEQGKIATYQEILTELNKKVNTI